MRLTVVIILQLQKSYDFQYKKKSFHSTRYKEGKKQNPSIPIKVILN